MLLLWLWRTRAGLDDTVGHGKAEVETAQGGVVSNQPGCRHAWEIDAGVGGSVSHEAVAADEQAGTGVAGDGCGEGLHGADELPLGVGRRFVELEPVTCGQLADTLASAGGVGLSREKYEAWRILLSECLLGASRGVGW